jgi:histidinol-phosphate aminotransferase
MDKRPLVPPNVASLKAYQPGKTAEEIGELYGLERVYKLASNENAIGPSRLALEAMTQPDLAVHRYPAGGRSPLKAALAKRFELRPENVILGAGSESIMACIVRAFLLDDDEVITCQGTFLGFNILVDSRGVLTHRLPLDSEHCFDLNAIASMINERTKIIYVANPNNPTGTYIRREEFEDFVAKIPDHVLLIWDEAYFEYANEFDDYPDSMVYRLDNVITLRTFSKAYGLAGMRLGYGLAHRDLIENIRKVRLPFEPSVPALVAGYAALIDEAHLNRVLEMNRSELPRVFEALQKMGMDPIPSVGNFIMIRRPSVDNADAIVEALMQRGVVVRGLKPFGFADGIRITVGTPEANETFLEAMDEIMSSVLRFEG